MFASATRVRFDLFFSGKAKERWLVLCLKEITRLQILLHSRDSPVTAATAKIMFMLTSVLQLAFLLNSVMEKGFRAVLYCSKILSLKYTLSISYHSQNALP